MNEVILNKKIAIERCISQVRAYYSMSVKAEFENDHLPGRDRDEHANNIAESAIDIANTLMSMGE